MATVSDPLGASTACIHHWMLESPIGTVTLARCALCGVPREFREPEHEGGYWRRSGRGRPRAAS
jgi:hypothetical protein